MDTSSVSNTSSSAYTSSTTQVASSSSTNNTQATEAANSTGTTSNSTSTASTPAGVYESSGAKVDASKLNTMMKESNEKVEAFKKMLTGLLNKQAEKNAIANKTSVKDELNALNSKIQNGEDVMVDIDPETRAQAQKDISEDGYYGVKQTSNRILDFAKAVAGDDPAKIAKMRKAVEDGFSAAAGIWGKDKEMPQITKDTYKAVMDGFDEWEKSANTSSNVASQVVIQAQTSEIAK